MPEEPQETARHAPAGRRARCEPHPTPQARVTRALGRLVVNALLLAETPTTQRMEFARAIMRLQRSSRGYLALVKRANLHD